MCNKFVITYSSFDVLWGDCYTGTFLLLKYQAAKARVKSSIGH